MKSMKLFKLLQNIKAIKYVLKKLEIMSKIIRSFGGIMKKF